MNNKKLGWFALSPLLLFLIVYLLSAIVVGDFYAIPISSAFLISAFYAFIITPGKRISDKLSIFSKGATDENIFTMIWIFILAGAFASTAKSIGCIDATVNFILSILPGNLIYAGLFVAACFVSFAVGTSVGTIVALMPVANEIAVDIADVLKAQTKFDSVLTSFEEVQKVTHCSTGCGGCYDKVLEIISDIMMGSERI